MTAIDKGYGHPVIRARGMAVANNRTESAKSRVIMKTPEANRRVPVPNRFSSNAYAVFSSPL